MLVPENRARDEEVQFALVAVVRPVEKHTGVATREDAAKPMYDFMSPLMRK